jgi:hypothetical protein
MRENIEDGSSRKASVSELWRVRGILGATCWIYFLALINAGPSKRLSGAE